MRRQGRGYTEDSFKNRAELEKERTKYYRKPVGEIILWSYIGETRDGARITFRFHKLTLETVREQAKGEKALPVGKKCIDLSSMKAALALSAERNLQEHGLLVSGINPENPSKMYGFTKAGITCLCDRLRIYGEPARTPSAYRDFLIADKLFCSKDPGREYVFAVFEDENGGAGINGVFEERYNGSGFYGMYEAYCAVRSQSERFAEKLRLHEWGLSESEMSVHAEYRGLAKELEKGKFLIPGIRLVNSDGGKSSFTMQSVIRLSGTENVLVLNERKVRHVSAISPKDICALWTDEAVTELVQWLDGAAGATPCHTPAGLEKHLKSVLSASGASKYIGKKRETEWIRYIHANTPGNGILTEKSLILGLISMQDTLKNMGRPLGEVKGKELSRALGAYLFMQMDYSISAA